MYRTLSWRNIPNARTLFAMVFMAGIGLIISIVALLYLSLHLISTKTNEIDEHRTALSVQGAIQTSVNRVSSLVLDNAVWDDAVREVYRPALDEHFNVIWGSFQSRPFNETNLDFFGKGLKALIAHTDERSRVRLRGDVDVKSVVFIDLDGFKDVNDIYGHSVGDDLIVAIAKTLNERVPPGGPLGPDTFIAIAETNGLIYSLGQFVLQRACQDLQPYGELKLSVNISPAQFRDPAFEEKVASVLEITRFPAHRLQLEVTESYVLENPERARMAIANLKALGTAVALDDFGTGYSSIGYLRRFNFDTIKIDKSLAGLVDNDEQAAALVSGTVRIANALGMSVVAEGVENEKQMKLLRLAGCDQLQGFWFSQPMPIESIRALRKVKRC